jgi:hypothetical protein
VYAGVLWGKIRERDSLEKISVNGILILKRCYGNIFEDVDCIDIDVRECDMRVTLDMYKNCFSPAVIGT